MEDTLENSTPGAMATGHLVSLADLFNSYPEILLATTTSFFLVLLYYKSSRKSAIPVNWPVLGMLPGLLANISNFHGWFTDLLRETGCSFQFCGPWFLGMDFLITCDPANVNRVFNVNFSNYPKGKKFLEIFDILGDGIFNADNESWKSQRKKAHGAMSSVNFRAFVARCSRDKVKNALIPLMSQVAEQGVVLDLQDVFLRLTFDMTCNLVFGVDPGCLSEEFPTIPFGRAMDDAMEALFFRHVVPPSWWKLMRWLRIGKEQKLSAAWGVIDQFVAENIAKKKEEKYGNEDLLTFYVQDTVKGSDKFLRDTTVNLMLAGRDTTGVALTWFFWLLAKNPRVKSKILEELECLLEKNKSCSDCPIIFNPDELAKLVYLHATLCECLRLYPSVPFEHKAPKHSEVLPSGNRANSKDKILFSTYSMGRMEGIWGKDCLEFKPERWISEKGSLKHEPSYKFLSFNCGPRTCLGKDIAFIQMKTAAAAFVSNFDIEVIEGHVVVPRPSIILHMKNGLMVRVKKRKQFMKMVNDGD